MTVIEFWVTFVALAFVAVAISIRFGKHKYAGLAVAMLLIADLFLALVRGPAVFHG